MVAEMMRTSTAVTRSSPMRPDLVLLEHAQELALHVQRDFGYFVEEQRPVVGQFEKPHLAAPRRPRERALHVAEQLAFEQVFGQGRAVDGHERPVAALAGVVDALREQFFTRPVSPTIRMLDEAAA